MNPTLMEMMGKARTADTRVPSPRADPAAHRADLTGADLTGADLTGADLTGADLTGADLPGADLSGPRRAGERVAGRAGARRAIGWTFVSVGLRLALPHPRSRPTR